MRKQVCKSMLALVLTLALLMSSLVTGLTAVVGAADADGFALYNGSKVAGIYVDGEQEYAQVLRAADDLKNDILTVTGKAPTVYEKTTGLGDVMIIAGTLGHSALIDSLAESGKLDVSDIEDQWEAFTIQVVENPVSGVNAALVIAGSDMRGTIYGIYDLSEQIGVSPWHWWGDVPVQKQSQVILAENSVEKTEMPDVKYRGIFLNDEENFSYWSRTVEDKVNAPGMPGANAYATIFELLLRLKANSLWPAMHETSKAFNAVLNPETGISFNAEKANEYGVIMGSSHCEMLLRNNATEWTPWCQANEGKYGLKKINNDWKASYDFTVNAEAMKVYWEEAVARNYKFENMYTIGLRGVHDAGINCSALSDKSIAGKAGVVKAAVEAQVAILEKYEQKYFEETGEKKSFLKIYCSYKEAAQYFEYDISLPEDTVIVWADDNYGYIRQIATPAQLEKYPSGGVYYHASYLGSPLSYLWISGTPLSLIYEEMTKAYTAGSNDVWILNVGDLKPAELPMTYFLQLGWDREEYDDTKIPEFLADFAKNNFDLSDADAAAVAELLATYYEVSMAKKTEYQGKNQGTEYSLTGFGDEAQIQINKMLAAEEASAEIYNKLDEEYKDAYYQLVHYMVRAMRLTLEKHIYQYKNQLYLAQGRFASVNAYAKAAEDAYQAILDDLKYYNKTVSDGRWDGILDPYTDVRDIPKISAAPSVTYLGEDAAVEGIGSICEGQATGGESVTLNFHSLSNDRRYIDVYTTGKTAQTYTITADAALKVYDPNGKLLTGTAKDGAVTYTRKVEVEERLIIEVDWSKAAAGVSNATITVSAGDFAKTFTAKLNKAAVDPKAETKKGYYESNGFVAVEAEHYSNSVAVNDMEWKVVKGLGRGSDAMKSYPDLMPDSTRIDTGFATKSPYLEYNIYFENIGTYAVNFYRLPTLNEGTGDKSCRIGFQLDSGTVFLFRGNSKVGDEYTNSAWHKGLLQNMEVLTHTISVATTGWHTIRVYRSDAGMVFDRFVLRHSASTAEITSVLGAPESFTTTAEYAQPAIGVGPEFKLADIVYGEASRSGKYLLDFSDNAAVAGTGYTGVDNNVTDPAGAYYWTGKDIKAATRTVSGTATRDLGLVYGNQEATFTVKVPAPGKYVVGLAIGDRQGGGVGTQNMAVKAEGETVLQGLTVTSGRIAERGFVVDVKDTKLELTFTGNYWTLVALEMAPYTEPATNGGTGAFIPDGNGNINIETETVLENSDYAWMTTATDADKSDWSQTYGSSGTSMYSGPSKGSSFGGSDLNSHVGPKLFYKIKFEASGSYDLWLLTKSQSDGDDSVFIAVDSGSPATLNDVKNTGGAFKWVKKSISVGSSGEHTLSIWMREDGFSIDKLVITKGTSPVGLGGMMCRVGGSVVIDHSELDAAIQAAEALDQKDYIASSYAAMQMALKAAKKLTDEASQIEINDAAATLQKAMNNLMRKAVQDADIVTGRVGVYSFENGWTSSVDGMAAAIPGAVGNTAPTIVDDADVGKVAKLNSGGTGNYSMISFPNPFYKQKMADGMTFTFKMKGIGLSNAECLFTANDGTCRFWVSGGLYMGYSGSRGYIDVNKPENLPGPGDKLNYLNNDEWYAVTLVFTDENIKLYINGSEFLSTDDPMYSKGYNIADSTRITDVIRWSETFELGGRNSWWGSDNFYADDVVIYDRALSADQVAKLSLNDVDKDDLIAAIEEAEAEAAKDIYLPASVEAYKAEIEKAKAVVYDSNATENGVANAIIALEAAKALLKTADGATVEAAVVDAMVEKLPEVNALTKADADKVYAVSAAYAALSDDAKSVMKQRDRLMASEAKLRELNYVVGIGNLVVHDGTNASKWSIQIGAKSGNLAYADRTFVIATLPDYLVGADYILTAMDSKLWNSGSVLSEFDVFATTDLYVAWDTGVTLPAWLSEEAGFENTGDQITRVDGESPMAVYRKSVVAGEHIQLGYVGANRATYMVFLANQSDKIPANFSAIDDLLAQAARVDRAACTQAQLTALDEAVDRAEALDRATMGPADQAMIDSAATQLRSALRDLPLMSEAEPGDVDKSGKVDVADIMKLKALIMSDKWSAEELAIGDLNESGALDVGDIMAVKNIIMSA